MLIWNIIYNILFINTIIFIVCNVNYERWYKIKKIYIFFISNSLDVLSFSDFEFRQI